MADRSSGRPIVSQMEGEDPRFELVETSKEEEPRTSPEIPGDTPR